MNIDERIKELRRANRLGQQDFAKKIGTSQTTVSAFEKGHRKPDIDMLIHICDIFNLNIEWFLLGTGPMYKDRASLYDKNKMPDGRVNEERNNIQHIENINLEKNKNVQRVGPIGDVDILDRYLKAMDENTALIRKNADLRIQAVTDAARIQELERENAEIPKLKARITELERELLERPKLPKTVPVDVSAKSKPTPAHGTGTDTAVVPGAGAGVSGVGNMGAKMRREE